MNCDESLLWTLVKQSEEPGTESDSIAHHLESCEKCREAISGFGGEDSWWDDARVWLSDDDSTDQDVEYEPPLPPIDLSFLEAPTHPEMLGRIGRYDVEGLLGRGGMGVVLRAYDSDLQRSVAVKVLAPEWAASETARRRFAREAQAAASVAHDNVIPIYNVESDAKLPYLVMRYVPGMTLQRWVAHHGPPDAATILRVAGQMAEGLAAAHRRGLVHRDIKPGNVLVGENIERVWITDFGLARAADSMTLTRTGVIAGTPHYMSPEQARGEAIDHRSDLFSLGCVLYYLCAGRPPFDAENTLAVLHQIVSKRADSLTEFRDDLPPSLVRLVHQLLHRQVDRRPQDCVAVVDAIADAQSELLQGRTARRPSALANRPMWLAGAGLVLVTLLAVVGVGAWLPDRWNWTESASKSVTDPWRDDGTFASVDPYIAEASTTIDSGIVLDESAFRREVHSVEQKLRHLERPFQLIPEPGTRINDDLWRSEMQQIRSRLDDLERPAAQRPGDSLFRPLAP